MDGIIPTDFIDYCGGVCGTTAVTPWIGGHCGCCGRVWGYDNEPGDVCRNTHVEGAVWWRLLDAENEGDKRE